jgi:hypothetical protein
VILLVNRVYLFLFSMGLFALLLFQAGLFRDFTPGTMALLLSLVIPAGFLLGIAAVYGTAASIWLFCTRRKFRHIMGAVLYMLTGAVSVTAALACTFFRITVNGGRL